GGDDQHGVIARDSAGDLRKFGAVNGGGERLRAAGRRFEDEHVHGGANIAQELGESVGQLRQRSGVLRQGGGGAVTALRFYQAKFLNVTRERGLGDAELLRGEPTAQVLLAGDAGIADEAENLAV